MSVIPFTDFFLISREEFFRYTDSLIYFRSRILWVFFFAPQGIRKWLFLEWLSTDHIRYESYDTICPYKAREFSAREHIAPDRYLSDIEKFKYTLIYTLIVSAYDEVFAIFSPIWYCWSLIMERSSRWEIDNLIELSMCITEISDRECEWLDRQYSTSTSSIGPIIDPSSISHSPVSEIMHKILKKPLFLGSFHDARIEIWFYTVREEWEKMECNHTILHRRFLHRRREAIFSYLLDQSVPRYSP